MVFTDLLRESGLQSPFDPDCLKNIAAGVKEFLDSVDLTEME